MDAELQPARGGIVVVGTHPAAVLAHDVGGPIGKEDLGVEVGFVAFLDARCRGGAQPDFGHDVLLLSPVGTRERAGNPGSRPMRRRWARQGPRSRTRSRSSWDPWCSARADP